MKTKTMTLCALFIALSFVGANLKIMGTIAFDSMPGFLGTLLLGPIYGAFIGAAGHFFTALLSGFPLSIPVHLLVMIDMAVTMAVFGILYNKITPCNTISLKGMVLAGIAGVLLNGPVAILLLAPLLVPVLGTAGLTAYLPVLSGAAALNIILAFVIYHSLPAAVKNNCKVKN
ncbi:ecf transporter substrate-specific component [Lucifera butyrica]|uniref:Ecf transporter substrate-specific component n=1 Tax=Lucifera butyrica TaxID=1351585 RepID=A0A498REP0_9FIRM|nr:ECF transporter S component [Lucifera butyrica]VBB07648.1 ecf transporter substrate-specific component [Lucifera butyrica]